MDIGDTLKTLQKLGLRRGLAYVFGAVAILGPSVLALFWFDREFLLQLSTSKVVLIALALRT
jgi:uncharacterized membrane protein YqjE